MGDYFVNEVGDLVEGEIADGRFDEMSVGRGEDVEEVGFGRILFL